jgi:hypothetical protein
MTGSAQIADLHQAALDGSVLAASRYPQLTASWRPGGLISISLSTTTVA